MKKNILFLMTIAGGVVMSSCGKLGDLSADNFKVNPTPLEAIGGEVPATINGVFPEKYLKKKAVVTVTPVLKYEGGEALGQSATFQGEKVEGNGTEINYKVGGTYTMKTSFEYIPAMLSSELYARFDAKVGKKSVSIPEVKIGYGVLSTSELVKRCVVTASTGKDAFQRIIEQKQEANIKFLINQARVRTSELSSVSIQQLVEILKEINDMQEERALQSIEVSAYASPDGDYKFNEKLAEKRQDASSKYLKKELKKIKMDAEVNTKFTAEDWAGFQELVSKSNLQDKEVILRVLSMYQDPEEREQQIRNMSSVFTEIAEGILPELRRARLIVNYEVIGRSDEQILAQFTEDASKLSVEELLYGGNVLVQDAATRKQWYEKTTKLYPNDYRAYNNLAQMAIMEGNTTVAQNWLQKAKNVNAKAPEANANLAILALKSGDVAKAEVLMGQASGSDTYNEILGNLNIAKGNYTQAQKNLSNTTTNSAALAQILNKDYNAAKKTLAAIKTPDATTSYLKAVVAARTNDTAAVKANLKAAITSDSSLKARAANDIEFANYKNDIADLVK
jgi:outer membrane protein OmpA-like peptidoglycan-associated protein